MIFLLAAVNASSVVQGSEDSALAAHRSHSQLMKRESNYVRGGGTRPVREGPLDNVFSLNETSDFEKFRDDQQGRTTIHPRTLSEVSNYTTQGRTGFMGEAVFPRCGRIGPFYSFWLSLTITSSIRT